MSRRRPRVDANHAAIREALRACGWTVHDTSGAGDGFSDLVAIRGGRIELVEVKDGTKKPSDRALTPDQVRFHAACAAAGYVVRIVTSVEEAVCL